MTTPGAFVQDRGGVLMQVNAFPSGYSNDSIYGYDDGVNKWIATDLEGIVPCKKGGIYANGSDMTSKVNALLSNAGVNGIKFDLKGGGAILISGTVTVPSGKHLIFEPGTYITGSGTISGGIIHGNFRSKLFDITLTIIPSALAFGKWSVRWFGAVANGSTDDQPSIQKTIDSAIASNLNYVYMPWGTYNVSKGILIRKGTNQFCIGFKLEGETAVYQSGTTGSTIIKTNNNATFIVGLHKVKGVRVSNIGVIGANTSLSSLSAYNIVENPNTDFINGCRNTNTSPHAGFIVDPFVNDPTWTDMYPDFTQFYVTESSGGSTDIVFDTCGATSLVVGFGISLHSSPVNGDAISLNNSWGQFCRSVVVTGQSQTRSFLINNFKCWGGCKTVFDSYNYGAQVGDHPEVDGLNLAGNIRYLCALTNFANKGLQIKRLHAEGLYALNEPGGGGSLASLVIMNARINFVGGNAGSPAIHDAYSIFNGINLFVYDSMMMRYTYAYYKPLSVYCLNAVFDRCTFWTTPINVNSIGQITFKSCTGITTKYPYGTSDNLTIYYSTSALDINTPTVFMSEMTLSFRLRNRYAPLNSSWSYTRKRRKNFQSNFLSKEWNFFPLTSGTLMFSNIDAVNLTADLVLGAGEDYNKVIVGEILYLNGNSTILDEYGLSNQFLCIGNVGSKDDATGTLHLIFTGRGIDNVTAYNFYIARESYVCAFFGVGDCSVGSNQITNVVLDGVFSTPNLMTLYTPYFPEGTYITNISGSTITVSNKAISNGTCIDIISANWEATEYGVVNPSTPDKFGYKIGDTIYNTDFINYPTVYKWRCSRSGITNTTRPPTFVIENL